MSAVPAEVGYRGAHNRVERARGSAALHRCVDCGEPAREWSLNHRARGVRVDDRGRVFSADVAAYVARCSPCHRRYDRRGAIQPALWEDP